MSLFSGEVGGLFGEGIVGFEIGWVGEKKKKKKEKENKTKQKTLKN